MNKFGVSALLILMPLTAVAHGEEALIPFLIEFVDLAIFVGVLLTVTMNRRGKIVLTIIFLLTLYVSNYAVWNYQGYIDYLHNMASTNALLFFMPLIVFGVSFLVVKRLSSGR